MDILHSTPMWIGFNVYILLMLALSLRAHQGQERVSLRSAALWSLFWLANGMLVNGVVWYLGGPDKGLEFLTGYLIEESLSVDNLFVMLSIFAYFSIPPVRQHRVLFWGILGAIVLRGAFILVGTSLVERFHWLLYFFGAFLVFTGIKMGLRKEDGDIDPDANIFVRLFRRVIPVTGDRDADHFIERRGLGWAATPMLVALVVIETSDVMFAFDSIPAIFSITTDAFIVYASNICAVLGLRSLYFLLERITTLTGRVEGMGSSLRAYMSSLRRVRGLRAGLVLPGHGSAFGDLAGTVSYLEGLVRMREATLLGMLRERPRGFWEMLEALFSDRSDALALVREVGILLTHLEKLEEEGVVVREEVGERVRWRLSP